MFPSDMDAPASSWIKQGDTPGTVKGFKNQNWTWSVYCGLNFFFAIISKYLAMGHWNLSMKITKRPIN